MAEEDQGLGAVLLLRILRVHDSLPLGGFAGDENLHIVALERLDLCGFAGCAGKIGDNGDVEIGIADDAEDARVELLLEIERKLIESGWRDGEEEGIAGMLVLLPADSCDEAFADTIGPAEVPLVVEAPDDEMMLLNIGELLLVDGVVDEESIFVAMVVEGGLVGDDEIGVKRHGLAKDVHRVGEACHDAGDDCESVAGFDGVNGIGWRLLRDVLPNARDDLRGSKLLMRGERDGGEQKEGECDRNPHGVEDNRADLRAIAPGVVLTARVKWMIWKLG